MNYILDMGIKSKKASRELIKLGADKKNEILKKMADAILENREYIKIENEKDLVAGKERGLSSAFIDRLTLTDSRIDGMADGVRIVASLPDPVGEVLEGFVHPKGMEISKVRTPLGVIAMIYESRPNVTVDAAALCFKASNSIILRGGSDAINSNMALANVILKAGKEAGLPDGAIQLVDQTDRKYVNDLITLNSHVDVVIPRGGLGLKKAILANASVPVIETGAGLCHTYIDSISNTRMAVDIIINAKTQRPGVCNAMETLLVHKDKAPELLPELEKRLKEKNVEIRGDQEALSYIDGATLATDKDWETEYLDLCLSIKTVNSIDEAIDHINAYSTMHSEAIVTDLYENSERFLKEVDASAVYVNASTRFTDGGEFGFGGEIGISTQKLHARGPMGLRELTTFKYIIRGNGQIR